MKYALVTGASTGIGRAVAVEFGKRGYSVGLVARNKEKLEVTKELVGNAEIFICDLTDVIQVNSLIWQIKAKYEHLDVLANIAGIWHGKDEVYTGKDFQTFDQGVILDTYAVGLTAPALLVHGLLPILGKGSVIVNLSGTFENGGKGWLPYFVSKRALEDFTLGLADELKDRGVRVNCVSPSDTSTEEYQKYFPEDSTGANTPEQVAKIIMRMCTIKTTGNFWVVKKGGLSLRGYHK